MAGAGAEGIGYLTRVPVTRIPAPNSRIPAISRQYPDHWTLSSPCPSSVLLLITTYPIDTKRAAKQLAAIDSQL
jgi:hypothetical protein